MKQMINVWYQPYARWIVSLPWYAWIMSFLILVGSTGAKEEKKRDLAYLSLQ